MLIKDFRPRIFITASTVLVLLAAPSFLAVYANEEGTLGEDNILGICLVQLFHLIRFPIHTLMLPLIARGGAFIFFGTLIANCVINGFLIERLLSLFRKQDR